MKLFTVTLLAHILLIPLSPIYADMVAPNPHCYVTGTVRSKGIQEKFRRNNPTEFKQERYEASFIELEITSVRVATNDEVSFGWTNGQSDACQIQERPGPSTPRSRDLISRVVKKSSQRFE